MTHAEIAAFLAICRHKNITKAAEALYTTQAALSAHLKALESELGCTLLLRQKGKRSLSLTAQGQNFYHLALQYQDLLQKMGSVGKTTVYPGLQITAIISVCNYLLPPVLERFMNKYPHSSLHLQSGEAETACLRLLQGKADLAFTTAKVETDQVAATSFLKDSFTIICEANAPYPDVVSKEDLPLWDEVYFRWSSEFAFWHQSTFEEHPNQFQAGVVTQIEMFVCRPNKWAFAPMSVANSLCASGKLRQCTPDFPIPSRSIYILRHRDNASTVGIQCFFDVLREVLQAQYGENFLL